MADQLEPMSPGRTLGGSFARSANLLALLVLSCGGTGCGSDDRAPTLDVSESGVGGGSSVLCSTDERPDPGIWAADVGAFATRDDESTPPDAPYVFVGSSSIRLWTTLEADMAPLAVVNNGFGGSRLSDVLYYSEALLSPYEAQGIVLYAGENDLAETPPVPPGCVFADFVELVESLRAQGLAAPIFFVSLKPSPSREDLFPEMHEVNDLVRAFADDTEGVTYVDVTTPMSHEDSSPRTELFEADMIHLNEAGYALWAEILRPFLVDP